METAGRRRVAALALFSLSVAALAAVWGLAWVNRHAVPPSDWGSSAGGLSAAAFTTAMFTFSVVGFVIASRLPGNRLGWFLSAAGACWTVGMVTDQYAVYGLLTAPGTVPRPDLVLAATTWTWIPGVLLMGAFPILLFPDGEVPSPRWRSVYRLCLWAIVLPSLAVLIGPATLKDVGYAHLANPFHIDSPVSDALVVSVLLVPLAVLGSAAALVVRYRRSQGQQRLQMKWLMAAGSAVALLYLGMMIVSIAVYPNVLAADLPRAVQILQEITIFSFVLIPAAIGIAVLKYRLYSIDVIIKRSILYAVLTGTLTLAYLVITAVLQSALSPVAGESQLAVAASTLAVAALFRPVRGRVQAFIDVRFDRARYDAEQTIRAFAARARDEVDLAAVTKDLVTVTAHAMRPRGVSLWLPGRQSSNLRGR